MIERPGYEHKGWTLEIEYYRNPDELFYHALHPIIPAQLIAYRGGDMDQALFARFVDLGFPHGDPVWPLTREQLESLAKTSA